MKPALTLEARGLIIWEPGKTALSVATVNQHHKDAQAFAALFAAAPEMYEALKAVRAHMPDYPDTIWQGVDEAIARAEGRQP